MTHRTTATHRRSDGRRFRNPHAGGRKTRKAVAARANRRTNRAAARNAARDAARS